MVPVPRSRSKHLDLKLTIHEAQMIDDLREATNASTKTEVVLEALRRYARAKKIEIAEPDPTSAPRKRGRPRKTVDQ